MSIKDVNTISNRLSLRAPQRESLGILDRVCEICSPEKGADIAQALEIIKSEYGSVVDFEREFPSICFALATGVGKTRLMGAFIAYLRLVYNVKNFFIVAPNLTIYQKLHADFTPNSPKYVFKGIGEFAQNPPIIVTGENYESGIGVRPDMISDVVINIFNIAKITARDKGKLADDDASKSLARIRRLNETIGESYFEYLASKEDLVLIMDESHRYRASAGWEALNDLKPVLGLELTATPQIEKGSKAVSFKNVIYNYPLACAIRDGFVKEPAVATRENFDPKQYSEDELERIKLHDAMCIHESTKADLITYAANKEVNTVKPFVLVVAIDINHAKTLEAYLGSQDFFGGRYANKILVVHSNTSGEEKDEVITNLLTVEDPSNPIEIVIHVNMLKEGWDVTNLYTIVPLRAANSKTLVEQSIGRGLRLPYGKRTGEPSVDRLTIVSHDKFQEIVDYAKDPNSLIRQTVVLGRDIPMEGKVAVRVGSAIDNIIAGKKPEVSVTGIARQGTPSLQEKVAEKFSFQSEEEKEIAKITNEVIKDNFEHLSSVQELSKPEVVKKIVALVEEKRIQIVPQAELSLEEKPKIEIGKSVENTISIIQELTINVPRIVITPKGESRLFFKDFTLDTEKLRKFEAVSSDILVKHLQTNAGYVIEAEELDDDQTPENIIIAALVDFNDINYDDNASVMNSIARQYANFLRSYIKGEKEVKKVILFNRKEVSTYLHDEMFKHYETQANEYEATVCKGFRVLSGNNYTISSGDNEQSFRNPVFTKRDIKDIIFTGYKKCLYPKMKFDSDTERRFSEILEDANEVEKWFKPSSRDICIEYVSGKEYEPDFIVEMKDKMLLCETKAEKDLSDDIVKAKATAAKEWCEYATTHTKEINGKSWQYLLIPHTAVLSNATLDGLIKKYFQ